MGMTRQQESGEDSTKVGDLLVPAQERIGVLGGTFDPIHYGHLVIAEEARVRLCLQRVLFVPAGRPPHKTHKRSSSPEHRRKMVELAIASNPNFEISLMDLERQGPSYTVDMLRQLRDELGPKSDLYFIMGMDSLAGIRTWHQPSKLIELCYVVATTRPGYAADLHDLEALLPGISERTILLATPPLATSGSDLRRRIRERLPIKYQTPEPVEDYIYAHNLYREVAAW